MEKEEITIIATFTITIFFSAFMSIKTISEVNHYEYDYKYIIKCFFIWLFHFVTLIVVTTIYSVLVISITGWCYDEIQNETISFMLAALFSLIFIINIHVPTIEKINEFIHSIY